MKRTVFIILLFLSISTIINSCKNDDEQLSEIYNGNLELSTQEEINTFAYKAITGSLIISFTHDITNLEGLNSLTSIGGSLEIFGNQSLTSLSGLENLTSVGQNLDIYFNTSLTSLTGLENITNIGLNLYIGDNGALNSLNSLKNITLVNGYLIIINNDNLISLDGLNGLTSVSNYLWITDNDSLTSLSGLENLISVSSNLVSKSNSYTSLKKKLFINDNDDEIIPLVKKRTILSQNGFLSISNNSVLESLSSLNKLTTVGGSLHIEHNTTLESLTGLENLTTIKNNLSIGRESFSNNSSSKGNSSLTDLCAIRQLIINGQITENQYYVDDNAYNPTYNDIKNNNTCVKSTAYTGHLFLSTQNQVDSFTYTGINGDLTIYSWGDILNLEGLKSLTFVTGYVNIGQNSSLTSLVGLDNLVSIGADFNIYNNNVLVNLEGLNSITSAGGNLKINDNNALINLCGIKQLIINGQIVNGAYLVENNAYNPTYTEIQNIGSGSCEK